jgi:transcriptional regulator with XRE-family HTH domain
VSNYGASAEGATVGERLAWLIEACEVSKADFAKQIDVDRQTVGAWTHGRRGIGVDHLVRIAEVTGVSLGWLRFGEGVPFPAADRPGNRYPEAEQIILDVARLPNLEPDERAVEAFRRAVRRRTQRGTLIQVAEWAEEILTLPEIDEEDRREPRAG